MDAAHRISAVASGDDCLIPSAWNVIISTASCKLFTANGGKTSV
jgi:hypothetical protein